MHGIVGFFGILIPVSFAAAFLVSLFTGLTTLKGALAASAILLVIAIAMSPPQLDRLGDLVVELPIYVAGLSIGLLGGLPGAAAGRWVRTRVTKRES